MPDIFAHFNQIWTNFTEIHPVRAALIYAERRSNGHGEKEHSVGMRTSLTIVSHTGLRPITEAVYTNVYFSSKLIHNEGTQPSQL